MENREWYNPQGRAVTADLPNMAGIFRMQPMPPGRHTPQLFHPVAQSKACTQCGATKTPQWREGPDGPKTLCNACGVKLCRQRRVAQEGKRKPAANSGTAPTAKQAASRQLQRTTESYKQGSEDYEREVSASRPKRKAAKRAASKTAEFAASGAWPTDGMSDSPPLHGARDSGWASADQYSGSPEEVQWHSGQGYQGVPSGADLPAGMGAPPPSPAVATEIGETAAAAVNLLCMSVRRDQGDAQLPTLPKRQLKASGDFTAHANQAGKPTATEGPRVPSRMDAFRRSLQELPADQQLDLVVIKNDVDTSLREAHAAEAAVGAVAQVLAMKQAAAMNARTAHMQALKRMRDFMTSIEPQQEMMQPPGKVRRVSP